MTHIKITKGLDIPINGQPTGSVQPFIPEGKSSPQTPTQIALNLNPFDDTKFRVLVKVDEPVKLGQPLAEDKDCPGRFFVAPAGGTIREIRRGLKRRLLDIVINVAEQEDIEKYPDIDVSKASREQLIEWFKATGLFTHIRQRPFNFLANPTKIPRHIFVKALESAPFVPPAELQVQGYEKEFQEGLNALAKLTTGKVQLVYRQGTSYKPFLEAQNVQKHTAEGPYPISNCSIHIQEIAPIATPEDSIWTLNAHDVVAIGYSLLHHRYFVDRVIGIGGPGVKEGRTGYFKVREGYPIEDLIAGRVKKDEPVRLISGDILTGTQVQAEDFLGFYDTSLSLVPESVSREFLYFFKLGGEKYTHTGTYLSGHRNNSARKYDFTTSLHGEHRPFIEGAIYEHVMPLRIPTMHLVRALMAEDYDLAYELGLVEVDSEDFALPTFICPSKVEMTHIVKKGLKRYAADILK